MNTVLVHTDNRSFYFGRKDGKPVTEKEFVWIQDCLLKYKLADCVSAVRQHGYTLNEC